MLSVLSKATSSYHTLSGICPVVTHFGSHTLLTKLHVFLEVFKKVKWISFNFEFEYSNRARQGAGPIRRERTYMC